MLSDPRKVGWIARSAGTVTRRILGPGDDWAALSAEIRFWIDSLLTFTLRAWHHSGHASRQGPSTMAVCRRDRGLRRHHRGHGDLGRPAPPVDLRRRGVDSRRPIQLTCSGCHHAAQPAKRVANPTADLDCSFDHAAGRRRHGRPHGLDASGDPGPTQSNRHADRGCAVLPGCSRRTGLQTYRPAPHVTNRPSGRAKRQRERLGAGSVHRCQRRPSASRTTPAEVERRAATQRRRA